MDVRLNPAAHGAPAPKESTGPKDLGEAARAFEGMLWTQIFQAMRKTVQPSGLLGDSGQARSTYDFLLDQAVVESAVKGGRQMPLAARIEAAWKAQRSEVPALPPTPSLQERS